MSKLPPTRRTITGEIRKDREQARASRNGSPFFGTGFHPNGLGGMDSDNYEAGVSGYRFSDNGNAEFNDLTLRGGIIGNDALTSPVVPGVINDSSSGFGIGTAYANVFTGSLPVPAGFTSAAISVVARVFALNNGASGVDYLRIRPVVGSNTGTAVPIAATNAGGSATAVTPMSVVLTGLSGGTIALAIQALADFNAWPSDSLNRADLSGSVLWFR
ncbi:hypothetical protein SAMN05216199_1260 [Pedococcus cremeus]|uniref:Uncharacterized protein n=1 Tax=Pedococcus cremeus TaxID=587636 RepID=A0A1H9S4R7_9MICO|nr:hypothetical protein [Pedococcus cremeus]SER80032.1 hypothetical protein SAMN05216199_1260 [Pedococcus cremeus]